VKKKIIKNSLYSAFSSLSSGIIYFFLLPFILSKIGAMEYGLVGISNIFSMSGYVSLLELGFQSSISKYVSEYNAKKEDRKIKEIVTSSLIIFICLSIIFCLLGFFLSGILVEKVLSIPEEYRSSFKTALVLVFISYLFQFPAVVYAGLFEGLQRFDILKGCQIFIAVFTAAGIILSLSMKYNYMAIIVVTLLGSALQLLVYIYMSFKITPLVAIRLKYFSLNSIREIWAISKYISIGKISSIIYHNTPRLLIGMLLNPVIMTSYEIVTRLPKFLKVSLGFINAVVMPAASEVAALDRKENLQKLFSQGIRILQFLMFPIILGVIFYSEQFLYVWVGREFIHLKWLLILMLIWNLMVSYISYGGSILLGMNSRVKTTTALSVAGTVLSIIVTLILARSFQLEGIIIGYVLGTVVVLPLYLKIYLQELQLEIVPFVKEVFSYLVVVIAPIFVSLIIDNLILDNNVYTFLLKMIIWCFVYWIVEYFVVLNAQDRSNIMFYKLYGRAIE